VDQVRQHREGRDTSAIEHQTLAPRTGPAGPDAGTHRSVTSRLDVLVVAPHAVHGGQEEWLLQLLAATDRLAVRVLLLQDGPLRTVLEQRGLPVEVLPVGTRPVDIPAPVLRLAARLRRSRPDVVLANGVKAQVVAGPAARLAGVPLVFARHDHAFEGLVGTLARLADRVVGPSDEVLARIGRADAVVIPPPRPPEEPLARPAATARLAELGIPTGVPLLGMLTRLVGYKGVEDAVRALALPGAAGWHLAVLGGDDPSEPGERTRLESIATSLGVAGRVHLTGYVPGAARLVAGLDILAVLTRTDGQHGPAGEGFGMTALEAMTAGVPVLAVEGGPIERRMAGRAGVVVPTAAPPAIAARLADLRDPLRRAALGKAGRELARDHPDAAAGAGRLCAVLAEAAGRPGAGLSGGAPVSVVVPVFNEGAGIDTVVTTLQRQLEPGDELIVVDDASTDQTPARLTALAAGLPQLIVVQRPVNGGPSAARNQGVAVARSALIACTDAGNDVPAGWLQGMRAALSEDSRPDLVAGAYRASTRNARERAMAVSLYPDFDAVRRPGLSHRLRWRVFGGSFSPERPSGRSLAFRRSAWQRVGGFREDLRTAEDTAFGLAVAQEGRCVLQTDVPVVWHQRDSWAATARMFAGYGRGDAAQGERVVALRNAVRATAALATPVLLAAGGRRTRGLVLLATATYAGPPMWRVRRGPEPVRTAALVPVALATQDVAKAYGFVRGLLQARGR
jgi:glycosyltransferase involved in cell wall biosynthesis/GT2 family glycosyltransferase